RVARRGVPQPWTAATWPVPRSDCQPALSRMDRTEARFRYRSFAIVMAFLFMPVRSKSLPSFSMSATMIPRKSCLTGSGGRYPPLFFTPFGATAANVARVERRTIPTVILTMLRRVLPAFLVLATRARAQAAKDLSGKWSLAILTPTGPEQRSFDLKLAADGSVTGTVGSPYGDIAISKGKATRDSLTIEFSMAGGQIK